MKTAFFIFCIIFTSCGSTALINYCDDPDSLVWSLDVTNNDCGFQAGNGGVFRICYLEGTAATLEDFASNGDLINCDIAASDRFFADYECGFEIENIDDGILYECATYATEEGQLLGDIFCDPQTEESPDALDGCFIEFSAN